MKFLLIFILLFNIYFYCFSLEIKISVGEYAPYIDSSETNKGFITHIVLEAFDRVGITPTVGFRSWARVENELNKGNSVSFCYIKNRAREEIYFFSNELYVMTTVFIVRKDSAISNISSLEDLKSYKIGISKGYSYGEDFDNYKNQLDIYIAGSDLINIRRVLGKRIDLFLCSPDIAYKLINDNFNSSQQSQLLLITNNFFPREPLYFIAGKTYPNGQEIIDLFNKGLEIITNNGVKQKIIDENMSGFK